MSRLSELGVAGLSAVAAQAILGTVATGLTALGSSAATALQIGATNNFVATTAASTGVMLPAGGAGDVVFIMNRGANALTVYPPTGATVNATTSFSIASTKSSSFFYASATVIEPDLSA